MVTVEIHHEWSKLVQRALVVQSHLQIHEVQCVATVKELLLKLETTQIYQIMTADRRREQLRLVTHAQVDHLQLLTLELLYVETARRLSAKKLARTAEFLMEMDAPQLAQSNQVLFVLEVRSR